MNVLEEKEVLAHGWQQQKRERNLHTKKNHRTGESIGTCECMMQLLSTGLFYV